MEGSQISLGLTGSLLLGYMCIANTIVHNLAINRVRPFRDEPQK